MNSTSVGDNPQLSSGGASTQVDPKTLRQREKNREAMRRSRPCSHAAMTLLSGGLMSTDITQLRFRFRERQKEKTRQDQSKVEDLTRELEQLRAEKGKRTGPRTQHAQPQAQFAKHAGRLSTHAALCRAAGGRKQDLAGGQEPQWASLWCSFGACRGQHRDPAPRSLRQQPRQL